MRRIIHGIEHVHTAAHVYFSEEINHLINQFSPLLLLPSFCFKIKHFVIQNSKQEKIFSFRINDNIVSREKCQFYEENSYNLIPRY